MIAAKALAAEQEPATWPVLVAALDSEDVDVYGPALEGAWRFEGMRPLELTEQLARERDEEPFLREMAVRTLRFEGGRRSLASVVAALSDRQRYVRAAAKEAIEWIEAREPADGAGK